MKTDQEILIENYVRFDVDLVNDLHHKIQELLKHQQLLENRKNKITKLKREIWIQNGM